MVNIACASRGFPRVDYGKAWNDLEGVKRVIAVEVVNMKS